MSNKIFMICIALWVITWPMALVHAARCYNNSENAGVSAFMVPPLYMIGVIYDRYAFHTECYRTKT